MKKLSRGRALPGAWVAFGMATMAMAIESGGPIFGPAHFALALACWLFATQAQPIIEGVASGDRARRR